MHNEDLKVYVEKPLLVKNDSDDETVLSDESYYDPSAPAETPVVYTGIIGFFQDAFKAGSIKGGIFTLVCSTLGKGMLMLPNAMSASGLIWSTIQVVACAFIAYFSLSTLTKCASAYKVYSYQKLAEAAFGNWYKRVVNISFFLTFWSASLAILVLICEFASKIFGEDRWFSDKYWPLVVATFFVYPLSLAKQLKQLRYAYIVSFCFVVIVTLVVFYESFVFGDFSKNVSKAELFIPSGISSTFCTAIFAYSCHPNCLDIFKELYNPSQRRIEKVIRRTMMFTVAAYLLIGVFGYVTFVSNLGVLNGTAFSNGVVLFAYGYNLETGKPQEFPMLIFIVIIMEGCALIVLEPLTIKPAKDSLQNMIFGKNSHKITTSKHVLVVTATVYSIVIVSFFVQDLASLVNVIGASLLSLTCFIMPASFYLKLKKDEPMDTTKMLCWAMGIGSSFFGIYATYINLIDMINKGSQDSHHH